MTWKFLLKLFKCYHWYNFLINTGDSQNKLFEKKFVFSIYDFEERQTTMAYKRYFSHPVSTNIQS